MRGRKTILLPFFIFVSCKKEKTYWSDCSCTVRFLFAWNLSVFV